MAEGIGQIPEINQDLQRHLQQNNEVRNVSVSFSKLQTNESRVSFVYDLLQENKLLPRLTIDGKSDTKSQEFRQKGNEMFKQKKSRESHELYTKSLSLAEPGGENIGLAYANRSAVLFETGLYEECLQDIQMALHNNYPERLKPKLEARQCKARELQHTQVRIKFNTEVPCIPQDDQNPLIQAASKSIRIVKSEIIGRHIVAARDIEPGEIIAVEKPFCHVLSDQPYTHCHHCLNLCYTLIPCIGCTQALFCTETCQVQAYEQYHQYECPLLLTMVKMDLDHRHLHLRVTIFARNWFRNLEQCKLVKDDLYRSDRYQEIHNLVANTSSRSVSDLFNRAVHAAAFFHLMKTHTSFFTDLGDGCEETFKELLLHHMQVGPCNFHEIVENKSSDQSLEGERVGDGAFSFLSMFNHSCCPNVVRYCYGTTTISIALEPIKAGEQCFDNYGCHHAIMPKADRRSKLKKQYFFDCTCTACTENYPLYDALLKDLGGSERSSLSLKDLSSLQKSDLAEAKRIFKELVRKIKVVTDKKPNVALGELQEALKQCCFIFATKTTPI